MLPRVATSLTVKVLLCKIESLRTEDERRRKVRLQMGTIVSRLSKSGKIIEFKMAVVYDGDAADFPHPADAAKRLASMA